MEINDYHILMGNVRGHVYDAMRLKNEFQDLVVTCNKRFQQRIISPYSITLGDEFQGVADSRKSMIETIFYLEEESLNRQLKIEIRYVGLEGKIETPINSINAHGMIGEGLRTGREQLGDKGRGKPRFKIVLRDLQSANEINQLFFVVDGIRSRWNVNDGPLIVEMINHQHDAEVGNIFNKTRSQIWKRRKTLQIQEYCILKSLIIDKASATQVISDSTNSI